MVQLGETSKMHALKRHLWATMTTLDKKQLRLVTFENIMLSLYFFFAFSINRFSLESDI